jgi:hypothetical protein
MSISPTSEHALRLARLLIEQPDPAACERCLDKLEAYCLAELSGASGAAADPETAQHLDGCVACAESYALLYEALLHSAAVPEPPTLPAPDLSFLKRRSEGSQMPAGLGDLRSALLGALTRVGADLRLVLSEGLLALVPPPPPALVLRAGEQSETLLDLQIDRPDPLVAGLQLIFTRTSAAAGDLLVRVGLPEREWPDLAGIRVLLSDAGEQRQAITDAWGEVRFQGVPQASLPMLELRVRIEG